MGEVTQRHFDSGEHLCRYMAEQTGDTCLLSFSNGKDSVAAWLQLRRFFKRVIPVYRYYVPGLRFIEESLTYYEDFFQQRVYRYPDVVFYRMLDGFEHQTPGRADWLPNMRITRGLDGEHIWADVRRQENCIDAWMGNGQRASDSVQRANSIKKAGPIRPEFWGFFPVYDWNTERMVTEFRQAGVKLPVDYRLWNRSFDSVRARFLPALKEHYPDDYARILHWFPMAEADVYRRKYAAERSSP